MRKILFAVLALIAFTVPVVAQTDVKLTSNMVQPFKHIEGSTISYTTGVYTIPSGKWAQAAELAAAGTDGILRVHLVGDAAGSYYSMPMVAGQRTAALFDKVIESGTTVDKASIVLFILN